MRILSIASLTLALSAPVMAAQSGYTTITNPENRPMLGVQMTPVPLSVQEQQQLPPNQGIYVQSVYNNTAAQTMGLQPGDVIMNINGAPIGSMSELRNEVSLNQVGDPVEVTIRRGGQDQTTIGQFQPWPANIPYDPIDPAMEKRFQDWQERRLARMQDEVNQMREMAADMAKAIDAANEDQQRILGIRAAPMRGPDGESLSWRFHYNIGPAPVMAVVKPVADTAAGIENNAATAAARTWHFVWQLASDLPQQEPL